MRLLVSSDEHYISNGTHVYSTEGTTPYQFFWREYLNVFEQVVILARIRTDISFVGLPEAIANGPNVEFFGLPDFAGPYNYLNVRKEVLAGIRAGISQADAYLLRGPGIIGGFVAGELERLGKDYATQVIGDPWDVFGAGRVGGTLRPIYRQLLTRELKNICRKAVGVSYVTRSTLQRRYPASERAFTSAWSDVQIGEGLASDDQMQSRLQNIEKIQGRPARLGFIGSLEQPYKGADVLLKAVVACRARGCKVEAYLAGAGKFRDEYEGMAKDLEIAEHVTFLGRVGAGKAIFDFLDSVDLFVMPSLTEGLPRAMIEAMARGCPCIGSNVGGIPELLDPSDLVRSGDAQALADKIVEKISSPVALVEMSRRNHAGAKNYLPGQAQAERFAFLHRLRNRALMVNKPVFRNQKKHIALVVTVPLCAYFFRGQIRRLYDEGFRVTLICSPGPQTVEMEAEGAEVITIPIAREIGAVNDLKSVWRLWIIFRTIKPDVVNVGTPKAGLLGGIAAMLAGVPHRVYTLHGLRLETTSGIKRALLTQMERIACGSVQHVRCVSKSLMQRSIALKLVNSQKAYVIGDGTANGVDCEYFRRTQERIEQGKDLRRVLGIPTQAPVIGFAGRITRDKGLNELYPAFTMLKKHFPELRLLLLGDFESGDPVEPSVRAGLQSDACVVLPGTVADIAPYYAIMDVLAFPTHREGFGNVSLEAQASEVPVVTTRVTGAAESIVDGVTGLLVNPGDVQALASALRLLLENPEMRKKMGQTGARWVKDRFRQEIVWQALIEDYELICQDARTTPPSQHEREGVYP